MKEYIDSSCLKNMFVAGTKYLDRKKDWINELNVFPVPDGDTGTNMSLTLMSAVKELSTLPDNASMKETGNRISAGTLKGARGNSGVIMSQLCRGFTNEIKEKKTLNIEDINAALKNAFDMAYKAVMAPKEGTILTVARAVADKAQEFDSENTDLNEYFTNLLNQAEYTLSITPDMLPVLKEAGVVDSGGQGLVEFMKGALDAYSGAYIDNTPGMYDPSPAVQSVVIDSSNIETADIKYGYCTEFIIESERSFCDEDEKEFKSFLKSEGDSIVCVNMENIVKVHVHTNHPGKVIEKALTYGQLISIKIDNMRFEHNEKIIRESEKQQDVTFKNDGFIAVCSGSGIADIFKSINVDRVIEGGQTMNPSTEDILEAIASVKARNIFILPNNSNIIMTARQAADICKDRNVTVIPTNNICQGINAMINYAPSRDAAENEADMKEAATMIKSGEVTYSIRTATIDGKTVKANDFMGIGDGTLLSVSDNAEDAAVLLIKAMADEDSELVTIYYGADTSEEHAAEVADKVSSMIPDIDVDLAYGGQQVYNYIISVE